MFLYVVCELIERLILLVLLVIRFSIIVNNRDIPGTIFFTSSDFFFFVFFKDSNILFILGTLL